MKGYDNYKDSGVEWIGKIPENWDNVRLKLISSITKGRKPNKDYEENLDGFLPYLSMEYLRDKTDEPIYAEANEKNLVLVNEGDILILWDGSKAGEIVRAKKGILSSTMAKIEIYDNRFESNFLNYLLQLGEKHIQANTIGMGIPHVNGNILKDLMMLLPTFGEQTKIAAFLDYKTGLIDDTIEKKKRLIDLLKLKRQAVINEAVTKGLNPNAPMKDSGIPSFGRIPMNWKVTKLKFISNVKGRIGFRGYTVNDLVDEGFGALVLGASHITWEGEIDLSNPVFISWEKYEESPEIKLDKGDIIIVQRGSTCGKVAIISNEIEKATINPSLVVLKNINANSFYVFSSIKAALGELVNLTRSSAIPMLSQEQIGNLQIVLPPLHEQKKIDEYLNQIKKDYNSLINQCSISIDKLQFYRQSLISEAVTGKIDVRDWQPPKQ